MSYRMHRSFASVSIPALFFAVVVPFTHAATPADQAKPAQEPAQPMMKKEPMAGEMKKDGMMKEDVGKAAKKWDEKMGEMMKKEKMK